jgi:hypothetical protein
VLTSLFRHRFTVLLATLVGLLMLTPAALDVLEQVRPGTGPVAVFVLSACFLLAAVHAVGGRRGALVFALGLVTPVLLLDAAAVFLWPGQLPLVRHATRLAFVAFIIGALLRHLFRARLVTFDTISASLCVYLLLGLLWASAFTMMDTASPGSIVETVRPGGGVYAGSPDEERPLRMLYFSFATLSSVGYGDIVPATAFARMCAVMEAIMGQGYLLVMVSRLVGIHVSQALAPPTAEGSRSEEPHARHASLPDNPRGAGQR